jgi:hypothetical protein
MKERTEGSRPVFFNLGSAEPRGSAKIVLGSAKYLKKLFIALPLYTGQIFKGKNEQKSLDKVSLG